VLLACLAVCIDESNHIGITRAELRVARIRVMLPTLVMPVTSRESNICTSIYRRTSATYALNAQFSTTESARRNSRNSIAVLKVIQERIIDNNILVLIKRKLGDLLGKGSHGSSFIQVVVDKTCCRFYVIIECILSQGLKSLKSFSFWACNCQMYSVVS
jgi:hypothetical protein